MALALYIHWPFCLKKCPYCDFNSHVRDGVDMAVWEAALLADMAFERSMTGPDTLGSIFFGGGTPSLMPPALVERLIAEATRLWEAESNLEITLEANPSSIEAAAFSDLARAGVNRVSLGLQSLDDEALRFLGRLHDAREGIAALDVAQRAFDRVSFDLIYARPGQSIDAWEAELRRALSFGTGHLSLYQLTIEPGTRFATDYRLGRFALPEDDVAAEIFTLTRQMTADAGLAAYEVSNHARPGEESRHNLTYWRYGDYAGIGPGAHGRRRSIATQRHRKPENFLSAAARNGHGMSESRELPVTEQAAEALMMGLRLEEGIDLAAMAQRFGVGIETLLDGEKARLYEGLGLISRADNVMNVTPSGMVVLDALLGELVGGDLLAAT